MTGRKRLRIVVAVLVVGILAIAVGVALAATTGKGGGPITAVKVVRGGDAQTTSSELSYVNLPGASTSISVPSHHTALILVRFSAESECDGGNLGAVLLGPRAGGRTRGATDAQLRLCLRYRRRRRDELPHLAKLFDGSFDRGRIGQPHRSRPVGGHGRQHNLPARRLESDRRAFDQVSTPWREGASGRPLACVLCGGSRRLR